MNWRTFTVALGFLALMAGTGCTINLDKNAQQIFDGTENKTTEDEEFKLSE